MKNLIKKILREDFDWVRDVKPEPIIGSCVVDKLDPSQTMWTVESEGKTLSGTEVIDISNGEKTLSLNKKFFLDDYRDGRYVFCHELVNESDDFDWIRDVKPNISFHNVKVGEKYNVKLTDEFYNALNQCFGDLQPHELEGYKNTTNVYVIDKDMVKHTDVYCRSGNNSQVISLHLGFYNDNGAQIADSFWVTEEMANLSPRVTDLNESDDFDWIKDVEIDPIRVGNVFHTRRDFTPTGLNAEVTFEIYDVSPDGKWVRFKHHKGSMDKGTYLDIDKINSEAISRGWDKTGYSRANSLESKQVIKNITTGFWKKVDVPGYLDLHPEKKDEIIQLGTNINESNDFDWIKNVPDIEFGNHFTDSDLNDKIFIENGVVTYELSFDEFNELVNDGYDDYYLKDLVLYNGTYEYGSDSDYFDDEEINYYPSYLSQEQRERLRNALKRAAKLFDLDGSDSKIDVILREYFIESEDYIGERLYKGRNDWDYVTGNYLYHLSENINLNRWRSLNQTYLNALENNNIDVIGSRYDESVKVITDLPYKHKKTVFNPTSGVEPSVTPISNLTEILTKGLYDIFSINWEDYWWSEFDSTGTDIEVQQEFEDFIDNIEEALDELENGED